MTKPLLGRKIVVTRPRGQASALADQIDIGLILFLKVA